MSNKHDDAIQPIRTRGAIRIRKEEDEAPSAPVRTRGAIRTRGAVQLVTGRDEDARLYNNLVADIVFFPAEIPIEAQQVSRWSRCANEVIVDGRAPHAGSVLDECVKSQLYAHSWSGDVTLKVA